MVSSLSFQNGNFLNGSSMAGTLTLNGGITGASLFDPEYLQRKSDYNQQKESITIAEGARDAAVDTKIQNVIHYIESGREDKAMEAYNELIKEMSSQSRFSQLVGEDGTNSQLTATARAMIEKELSEMAGEEVNLVDYIRENCADASEQSRQKVWHCDDKVDKATEEDLLNQMCGMNEEKYVSGGTKVGNIFCNIISLGGITEAWDGLFGPKYH